MLEERGHGGGGRHRGDEDPLTPLKNSWRELPDSGDHLAIDTSHFAFRVKQMPRMCLLENAAQKSEEKEVICRLTGNECRCSPWFFLEVLYSHVL